VRARAAYCARVPTPPPPLLLAAYRLLGWRLGPAHQEWVHDDITRRGYPLRQGLPVLLVVGSLLALALLIGGADPRQLIIPVVGVVGLLLIMRRSVIDRALRQQGLRADGTVDPAAQEWYADEQARTRRSRHGALTTAVMVLVALVLLGTG
jgi:hypothetical protein